MRNVIHAHGRPINAKKNEKSKCKLYNIFFPKYKVYIFKNNLLCNLTHWMYIIGWYRSVVQYFQFFLLHKTWTMSPWIYAQFFFLTFFTHAWFWFLFRHSLSILICYSFNELIGISSRVFYPDGTAVEDQPLQFHDPPLSPLSSTRQNKPLQIGRAHVWTPLTL